MSLTGPRSSFPDGRSWLRSVPMSALVEVLPDSPGPDEHPAGVFVRWLESAFAAGVAEPHVSVLSTVDAGGYPDARVLVLRDIDRDGWWFSGPADSPKGVQLAAVPRAALTFYWREQGRQVRIRGTVHHGDAGTTARDFLDRSVTARGGPGAHASTLGTACDSEPGV